MQPTMMHDDTLQTGWKKGCGTSPQRRDECLRSTYVLYWFDIIPYMVYPNITCYVMDMYNFLCQFKQSSTFSCSSPGLQSPCHRSSFGAGWLSCNLHAIKSLPFRHKTRYSCRCTTSMTSNLKDPIKPIRIKFCQNGCFGSWDLWWLLGILNGLLVQVFLRQPVGITLAQTPQSRSMLTSPSDFLTLRSFHCTLKVCRLCLLILAVPV